MAITSTELTSTNATTVFTASSNTVISTMYLCNYGAGNVVVDIHAIAGNSVAAGNSNAIYDNYLIQNSDTLVLDTEKLVLSNTDVIQVVCNTANSVTVTVSSFPF